jgi:hypothetical protein
MAKNIGILSDGTGQGASMPKAERTNVWKLWDATKKADPARQVTFYDEGLGAEHKREWWCWAYDLASRATGLGISQNIKDCYTALIEYYEGRNAGSAAGDTPKTNSTRRPPNLSAPSTPCLAPRSGPYIRSPTQYEQVGGGRRR